MLLKNLRILDLSRVLAGPFATMYLAEFGAEVIKVEPPEGDETRRYTPIVKGISTYFYSINRGKKSISINLKTQEGREVLYKLVKWCNVFIHNFRDETASRLGVDFDTIKKINPDIVYAVIRGFDRESSYNSLPAYDIVVQGLSGIMMATGKEGDEPTRVGFALADIFAGLYLSTSILMAVGDNVKKPVKIEINLLDSLIYSMSYLIYSYILAGKEPGRYGSAHPSIVPYQAFKCRDGRWIIVAAANNKLFENLCKALSLDELIDNPKYASNDLRVKYRDELIKKLIQRFMEKDSSEWLEILRKYGVPSAPVNRISDIVNDKYMIEAGLKTHISDPDLGSVDVISPPIRIDGKRFYTTLYPPRFSEHSYELLEKLGFSELEINELIRKGVIKGSL